MTDKEKEQTKDSVEDYFECITECEVENKKCEPDCIEILKEDQ